ncbi:hypothetical protein O181_082665 [Austropuccinia psidii MF-1]|uniref:Uncharacterized protein n=1 Tax=Austropuccinia psidii MF-1 TaxID=1389203 RepID=A0A9Q3IL24_9BASI|nr:hypothetical protein [Austropuccinia psidii MF-1]
MMTKPMISPKPNFNCRCDHPLQIFKIIHPRRSRREPSNRSLSLIKASTSFFAGKQEHQKEYSLPMEVEPSGTPSRRMKSASISDNHPNGSNNSGGVTIGGPNPRHSLAFELAAAMEPDQLDQSDILEKLGFGEDHDDDQVDAENFQDLADQGHIIYQQDEEYDDDFNNYNRAASHQDHQDSLPPNPLRPSYSRSTMASHSRNRNLSINASPLKSSFRESSHFTPTRSSRRVSRSTLNTLDFSPHPTFNLDLEDEMMENDEFEHVSRLNDDIQTDEEGSIYGSRRLLDHDADFDHQHGSDLLEAGLRSTAKFLNILKQSNIDSVVPVNAKTDHNQSASDRQVLVEKMISDMVRTMTEQSRDREAQIRELKEIDIALSRTDRRVLAELEALPVILDSQTLSSPNTTDKTESIDYIEPKIRDEIQIEESAQDEQDEFQTAAGSSTPLAHQISPCTSQEDLTPSGKMHIRNNIDMTPSKISALTLDSSLTPLDNIGQLKLVTTSLIDSLNQINEHTQISRQTQTDVTRKLKGVRTLVTNWKSDHESIENSKEFIHSWEIKHKINLIENEKKSIKGMFEVEINLLSNETEKLLNEAFLNATKLLQSNLA